MRPLSAALLSACILAPTTVLANDVPPYTGQTPYKRTTGSSDTKGFYLRLDTGESFSYTNYDAGKAPIVGGGVGYRFNRHLRTDATLNYRTGFKSGTDHALDPVTLDTLVANKSDIESTTLMANAYYDIAKLNRFTPYVGGGIGMAHNTFDGIQMSINGTNVGKGASATSTSFAWQFSAGTSIDITQKFSADIGYRYQYLGTVKSGVADFISHGESINAGGQSGTLAAHELQVGLRYRF